MKKKGFTLVELLSIIVILGVVAIIVLPRTSGSNNQTKESENNKIKILVENAAKAYHSGNKDITKVDVSTLIDDNLLTTGLTDSEGNPIEGCVRISKDTEGFNVYTYYDECNTATVELEVSKNGGTSSQVFNTTYQEGEVLELLPLTKTAADFSGWVVVRGNSIIRNNKLIFGNTDTEIYALWNNHPTLTVDPNGGTLANSFDTTYPTGVIVDLGVATKEASIFGGWQKISGDAVVSGNKITMGYTNTIVQAIWSGCETGYKVENNACVACDVAHATGYSSGCTPSACDAGYIVSGDSCAACNVEHATGYSSGCTPSACDAGYTSSGDSCVACNVSHATGYSSGCTPSTCEVGYTANENSCVACNVEHATAYSSGCTPSACEAGYVISGDTCVAANIGPYLISTKGTGGLSSSLVCGLYRYQGTNAVVTSNYVCFGTSDKSTCVGNPDRYMYRIIGIDSSGNIRLIKRTPSGTDYYWASYKSDCRYYWDQSDLRQQLINYANGYGTTWSNMIINSTWYMTDSNYNHYTSTHMAQNGVGMCNTEQGFTAYTAKAGAMMIHDFYLAAGSNVSCGKDNGGANGCSTSWINLGSNGGSNSTREWTMAKRGIVNSNCMAIRIYDGMASDSSAAISQENTSPARPVFYISSSVKFAGGTGTLSDPYLLSS